MEITDLYQACCPTLLLASMSWDLGWWIHSCCPHKQACITNRNEIRATQTAILCIHTYGGQAHTHCVFRTLHRLQAPSSESRQISWGVVAMLQAMLAFLGVFLFWGNLALAFLGGGISRGHPSIRSSMCSMYRSYSRYSMYRSYGRVSTDRTVCTYVVLYIRKYLVPGTW